jgi:hypothetical protein
MPNFLFKNAQGDVECQVSCPPGSFAETGSGLVDPNTVQVGDSLRIGGGGFRQVDEIVPDPV